MFIRVATYGVLALANGVLLLLLLLALLGRQA